MRPEVQVDRIGRHPEVDLDVRDRRHARARRPLERDAQRLADGAAGPVAREHPVVVALLRGETTVCVAERHVDAVGPARHRDDLEGSLDLDVQPGEVLLEQPLGRALGDRQGERERRPWSSHRDRAEPPSGAVHDRSPHDLPDRHEIVREAVRLEPLQGRRMEIGRRGTARPPRRCDRRCRRRSRVSWRSSRALINPTGPAPATSTRPAGRAPPPTTAARSTSTAQRY